MSFSFSSLIRLLVLMALGTCMMAVGLSRLDPAKPSLRIRRPVRYTNINEYFLDVVNRTPHWLDSESGQVKPFPLEDADVLEAASCAPWVDEKGRQQIVGRWSSRTKDGPMSMSSDFGLARYSFPSGELIDHISTEIVPVGPPCWFPGARARILFSSGDGMLYHFAFEPEPWVQGADRRVKRDLQPRQLSWRCPRPGMGEVFLSDLSWPDDPRMGGCVVVSLREQVETSTGRRMFSKSQIWWLKLNLAGTEIVDAGRLLQEDPGRRESSAYDERSATVGTLADGTLTLVYLRQTGGETGWELLMTPIQIDSDRRHPTALEAESVLVSSNCQPSHATFSLDGRWLNAITTPDAKNNRATRFPVARGFKP